MTSGQKTKTALVGLGAMGSYMAINLDASGYLHQVWNRNKAKYTALQARLSVPLADSLEELATSNSVIILSVSKDEDVLSVIDRLLPFVGPESIVIDTSTVNPKTAQQVARELAKQRVHFLDCPVSGGVEGAKHGTLVMMAGGDGKVLAKVQPILQALAKKIVHVGPHGAGQAAKAVNQLMAAGINQAATEALVFANLLQLDTDKIIEIINHGAAGNWFVEHRGKTMLAEQYNPGFKLTLHHKDLMICQRLLAEISESKLPLLEMTLIHYRKLIEAGYGDEDISALFRLKKSYLEGKTDLNK